MNLECRIEIVGLWYENGKSATATMRAFKNKHKLHKDPFSLSTISRLLTKFEETGSVVDLPGKGRKSLQDSRSEVVVNTLEDIQSSSELRHCSTSAISSATGIPHTSVYRILRNYLKMYPYRIHHSQSITEADKNNRLQFAQMMLNNRHLIPQIIWSDEAYFSIDGVINRHNCIIWSVSNPHQTISNGLHSPKVCVWMGLSTQLKIEPFFFEGTVTSESYLDMLQNHMVPRIPDINSTVFMQDGAPPHYGRIVTNFIIEKFGRDRVIGRSFPKAWPARSPDLNPLDFWFWGVLKARVYHINKPSSLQSLVVRIREECERTTLDEITNAIAHFVMRLEMVVEAEGGLIEPLI